MLTEQENNNFRNVKTKINFGNIKNLVKRRFSKNSQDSSNNISSDCDRVLSYRSKEARIKIMSYNHDNYSTVRVILKKKRSSIDYTCHSSDELFECNNLVLKILGKNKTIKNWYKSVMEIK